MLCRLRQVPVIKIAHPISTRLESAPPRRVYACLLAARIQYGLEPNSILRKERHSSYHIRVPRLYSHGNCQISQLSVRFSAGLASLAFQDASPMLGLRPLFTRICFLSKHTEFQSFRLVISKLTYPHAWRLWSCSQRYTIGLSPQLL